MPVTQERDDFEVAEDLVFHAGRFAEARGLAEHPRRTPMSLVVHVRLPDDHPVMRLSGRIRARLRVNLNMSNSYS